MIIDEAIAHGATLYEEPLEALKAQGFRACFTQTGGMCAALEVQLERGYLLITDAEDSLPWCPADRSGWGVGLYPSNDWCEGPVYFVDSNTCEASDLVELARRCLVEGAAELAIRRRAGGTL